MSNGNKHICRNTKNGRTKRRLLMVTWAVLLLPGISLADDKRAALQAELANLESTQVDLRSAETAFSRQADQLKQRKSQIETERSTVQEALAKTSAEAQRYNAAVSAHNARCAGTFRDRGFVQQCNFKKADLDAWQAAARNRASAAEGQRVRFNEKLERYKSDAQGLQTKIGDNAAKLKRVAEQIALTQAKIQLYRHNIDDSFLNDPRNRNRVSQECLGKSSLEEQVECMKRVFDGARSPQG